MNTMNKDKFETTLKELFPLAAISRSEFGICTWFGLYVDGRSFSVQITPDDGIGVSERDQSLDIDFFGHDEVFEELGQVLEFIKRNLAK